MLNSPYMNIRVDYLDYKNYNIFHASNGTPENYVLQRI